MISLLSGLKKHIRQKRVNKDSLKPLRDVFKLVVVKRLLGVAFGGIKGFFLNIILNIVWAQMVVPFLYKLEQEYRRSVEENKVKKQMEEIKNAKTKDEFNSAVDRLD